VPGKREIEYFPLASDNTPLAPDELTETLVSGPPAPEIIPVTVWLNAPNDKRILKNKSFVILHNIINRFFV
jgi:hypothetical protein